MNSLSSSSITSLKQIPIENCNLISDEEYNKMVENYNVLFDPNKYLSLEFESDVDRKFKNNSLLGFIDLLDNTNKNLYEFKFVNEVENSHLIRLIIYHWALMSDRKNRKRFKRDSLNLYNLKEGINYKIRFKGYNFQKTIKKF